MDTNTLRDVLATGTDLRSLLDDLDVDAREDFTLINPDAREPNGTVTYARVGRSTIMIDGDGDLHVIVHAHGPEHDDECWDNAMARNREQERETGAAAQRVRNNPEAQEAIQAGMPAMFALMVYGSADAPAPAPVRALPAIGRAQVPPAPVADLGDTDGPGFYL